jgi:hypothetical protein
MKRIFIFIVFSLLYIAIHAQYTEFVIHAQKMYLPEELIENQKRSTIYDFDRATFDKLVVKKEDRLGKSDNQMSHDTKKVIKYNSFKDFSQFINAAIEQINGSIVRECTMNIHSNFDDHSTHNVRMFHSEQRVDILLAMSIKKLRIHLQPDSKKRTVDEKDISYIKSHVFQQFDTYFHTIDNNKKVKRMSEKEHNVSCYEHYSATSGFKVMIESNLKASHGTQSINHNIVNEFMLDNNIANLRRNNKYNLQTRISSFDASDNMFVNTTGRVVSGSWGIDRIDQRHLPLDGHYFYNGTKNIIPSVYIIDVGILKNHVEFQNINVERVYDHYTIDNHTCSGHGTHVAGIIAGKVVGINQYVNIFDVRVLDCNGEGDIHGIISGLYTISEHCSGDTPVVINMSLSGKGTSSSLETALVTAKNICNAIVVVAAGNSDEDACLYFPASSPNVITVAASSKTDAFASFSNYGSCVNIVAPGVSILSSWTPETQYKTLDGTSMSAPHVSGVAASYIALGTVDNIEWAKYNWIDIDSVSKENILQSNDLRLLILNHDVDNSKLNIVSNTGTILNTLIANRILNQATIGALKYIPSNTPNRLLFITQTETESIYQPIPPSFNSNSFLISFNVYLTIVLSLHYMANLNII